MSLAAAASCWRSWWRRRPGARSGCGCAQAATPVTATASQVADQLFVAGDVARLSVAPSGTESVVLELALTPGDRSDLCESFSRP